MKIRLGILALAILLTSLPIPQAHATSEYIIGVPWNFQHKDTPLLCLQGCEYTGDAAWDDVHLEHRLHGDMYCVRASISMIANYFNNKYANPKLSQDRITFQMTRGNGLGPEYDLKHSETATPLETLAWALGMPTDAIIEETYYAEPYHPGNLYSFKEYLDDNRPILGVWNGHARVLDGYKIGNNFWFHVLDPWPLTEPAEEDKWVSFGEIPIGAGFFIAPAQAPGVKSDEPEIWMDSDSDGVCDFDETIRFGTDPEDFDSDNDLVKDLQDILSYNYDYFGEFGPGYYYDYIIETLTEDYPTIVDGKPVALYYLNEKTPLFPSTRYELTTGDLTNWHINEPLVDLIAMRADIDGDSLRGELDTDSDGDHIIDGREDKNHNGLFELWLGETNPHIWDTIPPTTTLHVTPEYHISDTGMKYISSETVHSLEAVDDSRSQADIDDGILDRYNEINTGIYSILYRYYPATPGWVAPSFTPYLEPFSITGDPGEYILEYYSMDKHGNKEPIQTEHITLTNILNLELEYIYVEGLTYTFNPFFEEPVPETYTLKWDFDTGIPLKIDKTPINSFPQNGIYSITLQAYDGDTFIKSSIKDVKVLDTSPVADFIYSRDMKEGKKVYFLDESEEGNDEIASWRWDFGDKETSNLQNPIHVYLDDGDYNVTLSVTDEDGSSSSIIKTITIQNQSPTATIESVGTVIRGTPIQFDLKIVDPGKLDTYDVDWDYGEYTITKGYALEPLDYVNPTHTYYSKGVYTVTATVDDNDGGIDTASITVYVIDPPTQVIDLYYDMDKFWYTEGSVPSILGGGVQDKNLCWAAASSNIFTSEGWAVSRPEIWGTSTTTLEHVYYDFIANFPDEGGNLEIAANAYFNWYYPDQNVYDFFSVEEDSENYVETIKNSVDEDNVLLLGVFLESSTGILYGGHALTCWGYIEHNPPEVYTELGYDGLRYLEIYLTDSDDLRKETFRDELFTVSLVYQDDRFLIPEYGPYHIEYLEAIKKPLVSVPDYLYMLDNGDYLFKPIVSEKTISGVTYNRLTSIEDQNPYNIYFNPETGTGYKDSPGSQEVIPITKVSRYKLTVEEVDYSALLSGTDKDIYDEKYAENDFYTGYKNIPLIVPAHGVLSNDEYPETVTLEVSMQPSHGTVTLNQDGGFTYTPDPDYSGQDTFYYKPQVEILTPISATAPIDEAIVTIEVTNNPPEAEADGPYTVDEGDIVSLDASLSSDLNGDSLEYRWRVNGEPWTTWSNNPIYYYQTVDDLNALVELEVTDGYDTSSDSTTLTVNNVSPILNTIGNQNTPWGVELYFDADAYDPGADTLIFSLEDTVPSGATIVNDDGEFRWTPLSAQIGDHTLTVKVVDDDGGVASEEITVTVEKHATTLIYSGDTSTQYSDPVTVTATLTDDLSGDPIPGKTITFTIGMQSNHKDTDQNGVATTTITLTQDPAGTYVVESDFAGDSYYLESHDSHGFDIKQENAVADYIGGLFYSTSSEESGEATVTLSATIRDITMVTGDPAYDYYAGDIRNAVVYFYIDETSEMLGPCTVGLVNPDDAKVGTATYIWEVDIGLSDSEDYTVSIIIDGYYTGASVGEIITVSKPLSTNFITGGGYIVLSDSAGMYSGDTDTKTNFGFNVKYNRGGKKLHGHINVVFRRMEENSILHVYQIKGNAMTSLSVQVNEGKAIFIGKGNLRDITDPLNPVSVEGNGVLQVTMNDNGEPGSTDTIGITLFSRSGGVWYSSSWTGTYTEEEMLVGGNLLIR